MRVMVMIKANAQSEAGEMPTDDIFERMGNYNEDLVNAGIMLSGEGLKESAKGKRLQLDGGKSTVVDGPFAETKELIAGFWLWQVGSMDEAVEWAKRCPTSAGFVTNLEIREIFEADDFGEAFTPELREQEERLRKQIESRA